MYQTSIFVQRNFCRQTCSCTWWWVFIKNWRQRIAMIILEASRKNSFNANVIRLC